MINPYATTNEAKFRPIGLNDITMDHNNRHKSNKNVKKSIELLQNALYHDIKGQYREMVIKKCIRILYEAL